MAKKKNPSMALPELPEDIQRKIVVSLPPKAFARSSILSKSWLSFYNSTHCSFDFTFHYLPPRVHEESTREIMNFDKTLSAGLLREKLTVEEFKIDIEHYISDINIPHCDSHELTDLVYKWLAALFTTNNIVKVLRIRISQDIGKFYMPPEIFSNESLQVLYLGYGNCILDGVHPRNLDCLRVLSLRQIDDKFTIRLLTACPILEQLTLWTNFGGQHIIIKGLHKLKDLDICGFAVRIQEAPALENVNIEQHIEQNNDERITTIVNAQACRRIKFLHMSLNSERTATHIQQIVSRLPVLENLILDVECATDIRISSRCLENLTLFMSEFQHDLKIVEINAPNLRSYIYGSELKTFSPHLMMKTEMLEVVYLELFTIEIDEPGDLLELRKALQMIEYLKLGVDNVELLWGAVCVKASRLDEKLNISATRVIEMLAAGPVKVEFDVDGNFSLLSALLDIHRK